MKALFKMASRRPIVYSVTDNMTEAQILLVDADVQDAMMWVKASRTSRQSVLLVAKPGGVHPWPVIERPIRLIGVLDRLDQLLKAGSGLPSAAPAAVPGFAPTEPGGAGQSPVVRASTTPSALVRTASSTPPVFAPASPTTSRSARGPSSTFLGLGSAQEAAPKPDSFYDDILVVDDSDVALKFMQQRIARFGFRPELAGSGEEALTRIATKNFKFVFLDVMMEGLDGYQTCRAIKQRKTPNGSAPIIVMLTSRGGSIDKIRGSLAGCDAYLTKPLDETALLAVLAKHEPKVQRSFQSTNVGSSSLQPFE